MTLWNCSHILHKNRIPILPGLIFRLIRIIFSCDIPPSTKIGKNVVFAHNGLGCVVNEEAEIGDGTKILQNVSIGGRGTHGVPKIGKNVLIGCGAAILGGVCIADNAQIGANAVVLSDIPNNAVAVGIPAKVIKFIKNRND